MRGRLIIRRIISMERSRSTHFDGNGTIYQLSNAVYLKRSTPRVLRVLRDGSILNDRAASKIRKAEHGWRYAANILVQNGAIEPPANPANPTALRTWPTNWTTLLTRPLKHPGNHRHAWRLSDSIKLPPSHQYPKWSNPIIQNGASHS